MAKRGRKPHPSRAGLSEAERTKTYNLLPDGTKRSHVKNTGKKIDPRRLDRAEELFSGLGPEGVPLPTQKIVKILIQEFDVSDNQARVYIKVARDRLAERHASVDLDAEIERSNLMFLDAFAVSKTKGDPHGMVASTHRRAELLGIFQRNVKVQAEVKGMGELFAQAFALVPQDEPKQEDSNGSEESPESFDDS